MTENEKAKELIATSETTVKVDPQNGWYLKRFAALQFEGSVDNFSTNMPIHEASKEDPENLPAGWYIDDKDYTTFSIANDPEAVKCLKAPLKKGGYNFEERKEFWDSFFDFKAPKLRLPVEITKPSGKDGIAQ